MKQAHKKQKQIAVPTAKSSSIVVYLLAFLAIMLTLIAYQPAFDPEKSLTNWDDNGYVTDQSLIRSFDEEKIDSLFSPSTDVMLNYHPLTMLTLAYNYQESGLEIGSYINWNVGLHLANVLLVFIFIYLLTQKNLYISFFCSLMFGIHPMHVESVAWIAERKDVLYAFFFLLSLIFYLFYLKTKNYLFLLFTALVFVASCLSKAMAVPLPLVLLLMDYFYQKKITIKNILEKIPFLLFSIWIGWNALQIQSKGAIAADEVFTWVQQLMFASYGFIMYWVKLFIPYNLSAFYPYPGLSDSGNLPFFYYLTPFISLCIVLIPGFLLWRKKSNLFPPFLLGMGVFILMIALVLQFISVGSAIMADRYSYLPYLGAFFLMASVADQLVQKRKKVLYAGSIIIALVFMKLCYERVGIWQNSETLWTDVIKKYPFKISQKGQTIQVDQTGVEVAYKNRGNYYREQGKMDLAFNDYAVLVKARVRDPLIYSNMANMYALDNKFKEAMEMYALALERNKNNYEVYLNRGISYSKMQKHQEALKDFQKAAQLFPKNLQIEQSVAAEFLNTQKFDSTIQQGTRIIQLFPLDYSGYFYRGTAKINLKQYKEAIVDLSKAVQLKPNDSFVNYNLSIAYNLISDNKNALLFAEKAKMLGYPVQEEFIKRIKS